MIYFYIHADTVSQQRKWVGNWGWTTDFNRKRIFYGSVEDANALTSCMNEMSKKFHDWTKI